MGRYLRGMCSVLYTVKLKFGGGISFGRGEGGGGFVPYYIPEGGYVPHFLPKGRILFMSTDSSFYLFNQFDWPKLTYTEFTFIAFTA